MNEFNEMLKLAEQILDRPNADPDDDLAKLSRQFIRATQSAKALERPLCDLLEWAKGNRGTRQGNPYGIPEVESALKLLARRQGIRSYFDAVTSDPESFFDAIREAGVETDHHESDLYIPVTPVTTAILARFPTEQRNATRFIHKEKPWYDVPFAYRPFWDNKPRENPKAVDQQTLAA